MSVRIWMPPLLILLLTIGFIKLEEIAGAQDIIILVPFVIVAGIFVIPMLGMVVAAIKGQSKQEEILKRLREKLKEDQE